MVSKVEALESVSSRAPIYAQKPPEWPISFIELRVCGHALANYFACEKQIGSHAKNYLSF